ncbi:MAG: AEC family transporter [Alphaproteobacteria bacterium]|nr:AEC family transporter [Alphaproteobacteria bacterium]
MIEFALPVFGLILAGYAAGKTPIMPAAAVVGLSNFAVYAAVPSLMFRTLSRGGVAQSLDPWVIAAYYGGCAVAMLAAYLAARRALGLPADVSGVFAMGGAYGNVVLLGIPLVYTIYGDAGLVAISKIIAAHTPILIPLATLLVVIGKAGTGQTGGAAALQALATTLKAMARNPIMIAIFAGLACSLFGLALPRMFDRVLEMLAGAAIPAALFALGAGQAGYRIVGEPREMAAMAAIKLVLHPAAVWFLASSVLGLSAETVGVATLAAAMPVGINVYLLGRQYDCYVEGAGSAMIVSTLLSVATVTLLMGALASAR